jgi:Chitobiase/beta-hexosaminidase C-terminal domain
MKTVTRLICTSVALTILLACSKMALTQCATPTLDPPSKTGPAGQDIKVTIETKTLGASLSWTDDGTPPTPTGPHIITAPKGDAITVFGRTLRAMAFKTGLSNSNVVTGTYVAQ